MTIVYFLISSFEIFGDIISNIWIVYLTKPLLMPLLIALYFPIWKKQRDLYSKALMFALIFSFIGDVALMFISLYEKVFLLGLGAFMITQSLYVFAFLQNKNGFSFQRKRSNILLFIFFSTYVLLMYFLWHSLNEFLIPVLIYGAVICFMGFAASIRKASINSYILVLSGAILFIISDTLIAFNKFIYESELPFAQAFIMFFYVIAQYLIIKGSVKSYIN